MTATRLVARPLLSSVFFLGAVNALRNAQAVGEKAAPVTDRLVPAAEKAVHSAAPSVPVPTDPVAWVRINAGVQLLAASALATNRSPRLAATVLAVSLVPTTIAGHPFWNETDPTAKRTQRLQFVKNSSILGGLILAAVDTEGQPGVAWRARRATKDARREARTLAKSAKQEARLIARTAKDEARVARAKLG